MLRAVLIEGLTQEEAAFKYNKSRSMLSKNIRILREAESDAFPSSWKEYTIRLPKSLLPKMEALEREAEQLLKQTTKKKK